MENLLNPDTGLIIWTIVTFVVLVLLLSKVAWKPLLAALKEREDGIRKVQAGLTTPDEVSRATVGDVD